jgi:hypothetical protein
MRADRIGQAWPRGSRCWRARRLRLQQKRQATPLISEAPAVSAIKQPGRVIDENRPRALFPTAVLLACVAAILSIAFVLF